MSGQLMLVKGTAAQVHLLDFSWLNLPFVFLFLSKPALSHPLLHAKAASAEIRLASQRFGQARAQGLELGLGKAVGMGMLRAEGGKDGLLRYTNLLASGLLLP